MSLNIYDNNSQEQPNKKYKRGWIDKLLEYLNNSDEAIEMYQITEAGQHPDYFVTNTGKVVSLIYGDKALERAKDYNSSGYEVVDIRKKKYSVSRLTAEKFCDNPLPEERTEVHHLDGDKTNNDSSNLRYISPFTHKLYHYCKKKYNTDVELQ